MSELKDPSKEKQQIQPVSLGFLADLIRQARLAWRLLLDSRVPLWIKAVVPVSLLYLVSPVDLIPDVALGLGQLDDLAVLFIGTKLFIELCPPALVREHLRQLLGETEWQAEPNTPSSPPSPPQVIDAPYEIKKDE
jgi:uncharacterized membrane protein YkvA (DUF1232 family)